MSVAGHHLPIWFDESVGPADGEVPVWNPATSRFESAAVVDAIPSGTYVGDAELAALLDPLIVGAIARDANGAATSAGVVWPNGDPGTYTATTVSTAFPGAVDAYTVTKGDPVTATYTQPTVTRDANGAVTVRPAITVA